MHARPRVSVVITNYNYERYLGHAVNSALAQRGVRPQVIVVDDGSTDGSRQVIEGYGDRIEAIFQPNGGQAAAFNTGFARSEGEVVIFLDADDVLYADAAAEAHGLALTSDAVKVQWHLDEIDEGGRLTGRTSPPRPELVSAGDLSGDLIRTGPMNHVWPPTSGNAWTRDVLEKLLPMDTCFRIGADNYLFELAPLFGMVVTAPRALSQHRRHGANSWPALDVDARVRLHLAYFEHYVPIFEARAGELNLQPDPAGWRARSWWHRLERALATVDRWVTPGEPFLLVDEAQWGVDVRVRRPVPFMERSGAYGGRPSDDAEAVAELSRRMRSGIDKVVVGWPAFWWLEHYTCFARVLEEEFARLDADDTVVVFGRHDAVAVS